MSHTANPFEILRWDAPREPDAAFLERLLQRDGLTPQRQELPTGAHTPEMKFASPAVIVLVSGEIQYAFPGYGTIGLMPGDSLEIAANVLHDVTVTAPQSAVILQAFREP